MTSKKRNYLIIGSVLLLTAIASIVLITKNKKSTIDQEGFYVQDVDSITKLFIVDKADQSVLVERQPDNTWLLDGEYDVNMSTLGIALKTLGNMRILYPVPHSMKANVIKTLSSGATKVEVYQRVFTINLFDKIKLFPKEKLTKVYYIGYETRNNRGTFVFLKGEETPYVVHDPSFRGFFGPRFSGSPLVWRSRNIFDHNFHAIQSIRLEIPEANEESFELLKQEDDVKIKKLSSGEFLGSFDTLRVAQLLSSFVDLNLDEFVSAIPSLQIDSVFSRNPGFVLTLTDTAGNRKSMKTFLKLRGHYLNDEGEDPFAGLFDVDRMYAVLNEKDTVLIQYASFDNILHPLSYFMGKR